MIYRPYIRIGSVGFVIDELSGQFPSAEHAFRQFALNGDQFVGPMTGALPRPTDTFYLAYRCIDIKARPRCDAVLQQMLGHFV